MAEEVKPQRGFIGAEPGYPLTLKGQANNVTGAVGVVVDCKPITSGKALSVRVDGAEVAYFDQAGALHGNVTGTITGTASAAASIDVATIGDSTGTPGDATLNTQAGKSAVALGASACVITNNLVTANSLVMITPLENDATLVTYKAVCTSNTITVTGNTTATAAWPFAWLVVN